VLEKCKRESYIKATTNRVVIYESRHTRKQISYSLEINLHIRNLDEVFKMRFRLDNVLEDVLRNARNDTLQLSIIDVCTLYYSQGSIKRDM
jgi:regulator of sigma D